MTSKPTSSLVILSLPPKTLVGLDLISFDSSPNFQGIAGIPPGVHFLYTGTDASLSIRHGRWLNLSATSSLSLVLRWSTHTEQLDVAYEDDPETENVPTPTRGLIDYSALQGATADLIARESDTEKQDSDALPTAGSTDWPSLCAYITPVLLSRVLATGWAMSSISSAPVDMESIPGLSHMEAADDLHQSPLDFLPVDLKKTWADEDIGRVRTDRARDRSWYLGQLIERATPTSGEKAVGARQLLGEIQLCFLMVLTLANYSCLEQWKRLLSVVLTCRVALDEAEAFFVQGVKLLSTQLRHVEDVEGGLFDLRDEHASAWLRRLWARFRATVEDETVDGRWQALKHEVTALQRYLEETYAWHSERDILRRGTIELEDGERVEVSMPGVDEDEETGEYAPVIVET